MSKNDRMDQKEPLYRSVNTRTHNVRHGFGGDYKWSRRTQEDRNNRGAMHSGQRHGRDYTPLFRFLLSHVGDDWAEVYREAVSRLDRPEPIFSMVARCPEERQATIRTGESTYYSGLYVDADHRLRRVDPLLSVETMEPSCGCCTHTFNGVRFTQSFKGVFPGGTRRKKGRADKPISVKVDG